MKLHQWISIKKVTQTAVAGLLGKSVSQLNRHLTHNRNLDHESIRRLYFISHGAVQPNDFFDLENCPEDLREHYYGKKFKEVSSERTAR
jgi:hypothetical protein